MVAWAGEDVGAMMSDGPSCGGEGGFTVLIAKLANGDEIVPFHG